MANSVACALIHSRRDYANALYTGMSSTHFDKMQRTQNTLARILSLTAKRDHIMPTLERLHWLPIRYHVDYKLARLTYKIHLSGEPPDLLSQLVDYTPVRSLEISRQTFTFCAKNYACVCIACFQCCGPSTMKLVAV